MDPSIACDSRNNNEPCANRTCAIVTRPETEQYANSCARYTKENFERDKRTSDDARGNDARALSGFFGAVLPRGYDFSSNDCIADTRGTGNGIPYIVLNLSNRLEHTRVPAEYCAGERKRESRLRSFVPLVKIETSVFRGHDRRAKRPHYRPCYRVAGKRTPTDSIKPVSARSRSNAKR